MNEATDLLDRMRGRSLYEDEYAEYEFQAHYYNTHREPCKHSLQPCFCITTWDEYPGWQSIRDLEALREHNNLTREQALKLLYIQETEESYGGYL